MVIKKVRKDAAHKELENSSYFNDRIGFWGYVKEVNSATNRVNVISDTGQELTGIPVFSSEWVIKKDNYVSGSRNLPPVNSRVFVLMPTHTPTGAFVLCSGYAAGENNTHALYADKSNSSDVKDKNSILEKISQGGWHITENYNSGNALIESKDKKVSITIDLEDDKNGIEISAWNQKVIITSEKLEIKPVTDIKVDAGTKKISFNGSEIDLNGSSKTLVTYEALNTALTQFITKLNLAMTQTPIIGNGSPQETWTGLPTSIDISKAKASDLKTGGA